jgi:hypothetical protein
MMTMIFDVQQYELHILTRRVEADDPADAIRRVFAGDGEATNFEFAGIANDHGMSLDDDRNLADQLYDRGIIKPGHSIVPSIRSVRQVVDEGDEDE